MNETQELALKRVFDRVPLISQLTPSGTVMPMPVYDKRVANEPMTFDAFKALAYEGYGYVIVPWAGMWLGIEQDGYTHS